MKSLGSSFCWRLGWKSYLTRVATYRRKIILSARKRVSKGDFSPQTPFDTPFQGYSGCLR